MSTVYGRGSTVQNQDSNQWSGAWAKVAAACRPLTKLLRPGALLPPSLPPTWTSNSSSLPASISCLPRRPVPSVPSRAALPCKNGDIVLAERMKESSIVWRRRAPSLKRVLRANSCPARRRVKDHPVVVSHDKTQSLSLSPRRRAPSYSGEREGRFDGEEALGVGSKASDAHGDFRHLS